MGPEKTLRELIGEAIGEASMCWSETPEGTFDADAAKVIMDKLVKDIHQLAVDGYLML